MIDFAGEFYEAGGEVFVGVWSKGRGDCAGLRGVGWSWGADGAGLGGHFKGEMKEESGVELAAGDFVSEMLGRYRVVVRAMAVPQQ